MTLTDMKHWLEELDLDQYAAVFADNDVDLDALPHLTDEDLKELGLSLGHRRKLLAAIESLNRPGSDGVEQTPAPASVPPAQMQSEAERRHLTVMMCDLVGSTALSERLDPEDLRDIIKAYQDACAAVITRFDGFVARYVGDGILAYFGYPRAHEDDAGSAARAGLGIVEAVSELQSSSNSKQGEPLAVRVGIATGMVVVGDLIGEAASQESAVVGETPNLAARLQGLAASNAVVIGPHTRELVGERFDCTDLGLHELKGLTEPVRAWRVTAVIESQPGLEAATAKSLIPLVGRDEELQLLLRRWQQAKDGECRVVVLSGEAGIGKSRIVQELQTRLGNELRNRVLYFGSPYYRNSAFHPIINQVERALRFDKDDDAVARLDKLEASVRDLGLPVDETASAVATLLTLPIDARYPPFEGTAEELKQKILQSSLAFLEAMAERETVLMVVEDMHWIDPSSREFINLVVGQLQACRVLLVVTCRPEFESPWAGQSHVTYLTLSRLAKSDSEVLVGELARGAGLSDELLDRIVERTDGIPLFLEELTKTLLESVPVDAAGNREDGSAAPERFSIPASLQDSLMARLDRLDVAKGVAQLAAVLGRRFSEELLRAVWPHSQDELTRALTRLVDAELVYQRGLSPDATYTFKHALVQDVAYQSLLKATRRDHHRRIAGVLEEKFPKVVATEPEVLGRHFSEGGLADRAVHYWQLAADLAVRRSADMEAVSHFGKGLEQLNTLPESVERDTQELALRIGLGPSLSITKGHGSPDFIQNYERARPLFDRVGEASQRFPVIWGLWYAKNQTGQIAEACALADELLEIGRQQTDTGILLEAHHSAWTSRFAGGDLRSVVEHAKQGAALYDIDQHGSHAMLYGGHDPGVCCRFVGGLALSLLGFLDQGRDWGQESLGFAEKLAHQPTLAFALSFTTSIHYLRREPHIVRECADRASILCAEYGFAFIDAMAKLLHGWSLAAQGETEDGLELSTAGFDAVRATGIQRLSFQFTVLAQVLHWAGDTAKALEALEEALSVVNTSGEMRWAPDIYRLKGDFLLARPNGARAEAERCFQHGIALAREQEARLFELRAAIGLARLWRDQGRTQDARKLLAPVYTWFTEGLDLPDLADAGELVGELGR